MQYQTYSTYTQRDNMGTGNGDILKLAEDVLNSGKIPPKVSRKFMVALSIQTHRKLGVVEREVQKNSQARKFMWAVVIAGGIQILVQFAPK